MKLFQDKFKNAFRGMIHAFHDLGVRIQLIIVIFVLAFFAFFNLTQMEWIIIILCCGLVVVAEVVNYIVEILMNFIQPEYNKEVGRIKDISAGMVLITALLTALIGLIILGEKLW